VPLIPIEVSLRRWRAALRTDEEGAIKSSLITAPICPYSADV
jgi:hypothetical protein